MQARDRVVHELPIVLRLLNIYIAKVYAYLYSGMILKYCCSCAVNAFYGGKSSLILLLVLM